MAKIVLKDLAFYAYHGLHKSEREIGQEFIVNVEIETIHPVYGDDDIDKTVDYQKVYDAIKSTIAQPQQLLESVVYNIGMALLDISPLMKSCKVSIKKFPQLGGKIGGVVVEDTFES